MHTKRIMYPALAALVVALGAWALISHRLALRGGPQAAAPETYAQEVADAETANASGLSSVAAAAAGAAAAEKFSHTYANTSYGFSFGYPDPLKAGSFADPSSGAFTVTTQDAASHIGFQVYIRPWQGGAVTASEVAQDLPQIGPNGFAPVSVDGAPGVAFLAADPAFGSSRQVWFARAGYLYQVSTYASQSQLLGKVLGTWTWSK